MGTAAHSLALELRHNDEPLGRVRLGGAVDIELEVLHADARFWLGLPHLRSSVALTRQLLPRPRGDIITFIVR
jgi:hypothetical protein